jgi:hypothetical protein
MSSLNDVFQKLGLNSSNGLYFFQDEWADQVKFSDYIKRIFEKKLKPTAFFCFDSKPLILFFENPPDNKDLHRKIWNFNGAPIIIIVKDAVVEIFNGFKLSDQNNGFLDQIGGNEVLNDFTYFELVTGKTWEKYQEKLRYENRVDYMLLSNIRGARQLMLDKFPTPGDKEEEKLYTKITNALLGKIIFTRYLIDRGVKLQFENNHKSWSNADLCNLLKNHKKTKQFFDYLADPDKGFNGDLFPLTPEDYSEIPKEAYKEIIQLLEGNDVGTGQLSLFDMYDFSIIPIEFISNIYESFVGQENQEKEGVYYTPLFLVDYILSETVSNVFESKQNHDCKVLDPACGSGVFLVESLRKIIEKYIKNNLTNPPNKKQFKKNIKGIVENNIYGIDKDESAIQVAIFSVYLTLLDYMEPPEIATFKFPKLLNRNFFCNDFFDTEADFNTKLKGEYFSFIIGNPPWKRGNEDEKPRYVKYITDRRNEEKNNGEPYIEIGNKEIAQAFLLRTRDFSKENTKCALIVTSKILYNLQSINFRKYFLHYYLIDHVFELAAVRREVFSSLSDKSVAPAVVLFFRYALGKHTDSNIIKHIALKPSRFFFLFKIFAVARQDIQKIQQGRLKEYDFLWKILVYGSYLDFNFIKRLKDNYPTINEIISKNQHLTIGQGIMVGGGDTNDASDLVGKRFLDTRTDIKRFWVNPNNTKVWQDAIVHRIRNRELYKAPVLLITAGIKRSDLKSVAAICYQDSVYKSSLTGIKTTDRENIYLLRQIAGFLNSNVFSYYNLMTFSSTGIEREESHDEEKWSMPFSEANEIHHIVKEIEKSNKEFYDNTSLIRCNIDQEIAEKTCIMDKAIYSAFSMTKEEKCLVDYVNDIIIPIQMKHKGYEQFFLPCDIEDKILREYANLFLDRFKGSFTSINKMLIVEIWHTDQIVGMFFKVVRKSDKQKEIDWKDKKNDMDSFFQVILNLSSEKITDQLFVQKDIRGFEKEFFYIFKPNEKRLWHKAIGYLDVNEFADAMHQTDTRNGYE